MSGIAEDASDDKVRANGLASEIVALIKSRCGENYGGDEAQAAVLLAQHRLFGGCYLSKLLVGLYPRS